jgi:hypothetical protein
VIMTSIAGALARPLAHARAFWLDERLSQGSDPASSPVMAARASALTSRRSREQLAGALDQLLDSAQRPHGRLRLHPPAATVLPNEPAIAALARRLREPRPVYAQGLAQLSRLLSDSDGAVFGSDAQALATALARARARLEGGEPGGRPARREGDECEQGELPGRQGRARQPIGNSVALPGGSWQHGRREAS